MSLLNQHLVARFSKRLWCYSSGADYELAKSDGCSVSADRKGSFDWFAKTILSGELGIVWVYIPTLEE